jgi:hypothetical protein
MVPNVQNQFDTNSGLTEQNRMTFSLAGKKGPTLASKQTKLMDTYSIFNLGMHYTCL